MKFSYSLIKKFAPGIPLAKKFANDLSLKSFEVEEIVGNMIDIKITANRWADAASHIGIAREAAAIYGIKNEIPKFAKISFKGNLAIRIEKDADTLRYIGAKLSLGKKGVTPSWMKKSLESAGLRSINAVVDILNYVMIETGQPMHVFDASVVSGTINPRKAKRGEKMTTLDGKTLVFSDKDTVIADDKKILAAAGIKGGKDAEITGGTKEIIVEAATFDAVSVYRSARNIGLATDASQRYGHTVKPIKAEWGMSRAIALLTEICGAKTIAINDVYPKKSSIKKISWDNERFFSITGVRVSDKEAFAILKRLGFKIDAKGIIEAPEERNDIDIFEDIAEEVIRIYGLDNVIAESPKMEIVPQHDHPTVAFKKMVRMEMALAGFDEVYNYSFSEEETAIELANPLAENKRFMRNSLIPGIKKNLELNKKNFDNVRIFEIGKVFLSTTNEKNYLTAAISEKGNKESHRKLKGALQSATLRLGTKIDFSDNGETIFVMLGSERIGMLGSNKSGSESWFEIDLDKVADKASFVRFSPIPSYPSISRDISLWLDHGAKTGDAVLAVSEASLDNLESVSMTDRYEGENGKIAITIRLLFRSFEKTLSDKEVDNEMTKAISALNSRKGLILR